MAIWGLSATILAPVPDTLRFAAYHLEQGAHRLYLYLDDGNAEAFAQLKSHPKVRVHTCDAAHWKRLAGTRPARHQVRQSVNATHAYHRRQEVDWLIHMDVDEFLVPALPLATQLADVPDDVVAARVRPMELLGGSRDMFKAFIPAGPERQALVQALYPTFGRHLRGGFVSHVAGKIFVRTCQPEITVQIHDALRGSDRVPSQDLPATDLAHCHAKSWADWRAGFAYRLDKGAYRSEIKPAQPPERGGLSIHDLLSTLAETEGDAGLRAFYDEVIGDSPALRARLLDRGLLRQHRLDLDGPLRRHFPDYAI